MKDVKTYTATYDVAFNGEIIDKVETLVTAADEEDGVEKIKQNFSCIYEEIKPINIRIYKEHRNE